MNNPPDEIMTPPTGFEWTGEYRKAKATEWFALPEVGTDGGPCYRAVYGKSVMQYAILREILPPMVTLEVPRDAVEHAARVWQCSGGAALDVFGDASRKALEQEKN